MKYQILFNEDFQPERIGGSRKMLKDIGMTLNKKAKKTKWMWDYENESIKIPKQKYVTILHGLHTDDDCVDVEFENCVVFGYVDKDDFKTIVGEV